MEQTYDIFHRPLYESHRQDMGGNGSFSSTHWGLYVGNITPYRDTEEVLRRHFGEFGELESVTMPKGNGVIAFVNYTNKANAQFAREAMKSQPMDNPKEVLKVRWAHDDRNPRAVEKRARIGEAEGGQGVCQDLLQGGGPQRCRQS